MTQRKLVRDFGTCLSFNGASSVVDIGQAAALSPAVFSVSVFFNASDVLHEGYILGNPGTTGFLLGINRDNNFSVANPGYLSAYIWGVSSGWCDSSACILKDKWNHAVLTYDGANVKIYVNDVLVATKAETGAMSALNTHMLIGKRDTQFFKGFIDELYIYNRVLSLTEIASICNRNSVPADYVAGYNFDEESGTTLIDVSGNGNTGTITDGTYSTNVACKPRRTL